MELEDYAHFRAELAELSPQSFKIEELQEIVDDMTRSKVAMENHMREYFATRSEIEQTMPLDMLGKSGYRDRDCDGTACSWMAPRTGKLQRSSTARDAAPHQRTTGEGQRHEDANEMGPGLSNPSHTPAGYGRVL